VPRFSDTRLQTLTRQWLLAARRVSSHRHTRPKNSYHPASIYGNHRQLQLTITRPKPR